MQMCILNWTHENGQQVYSLVIRDGRPPALTRIPFFFFYFNAKKI